MPKKITTHKQSYVGRSKLARTALPLTVCLLFGPIRWAQGAVDDVFPGDYTALPTGLTVVASYAYAKRLEGPYQGSVKQLDGKLDVPILAVRASHFIKLGDYTFSPLLILAWSQVHASPSAFSSIIGPNASGIADARVGGTLWLKDDPAKQEYLGVTASLVVPTGSYDASRLLNVGEHRFAGVLSGGWIKPLTPELKAEISPEVVFYSNNQHYLGRNTLHQDATYAITGTLRYAVSSQAQVFSTLLVNRGGSVSINAVNQHNAPESTRLSLGMTFSPNINQQWIVRYGRDVQNDNGFKTAHELVLRYLTFF